MPVILNGKSLRAGALNGKTLKHIYNGDKLIWSSKVAYSDDFNRSSLGSNWSAFLNPIPVISSQRVLSQDTARSALYVRPFATTEQEVSALVGRASEVNSTTVLSSGLFIRAKDTSNYVIVTCGTYSSTAGEATWRRSIQIRSVIGGTDTTRVTATNTLNAISAVMKVTAQDNVYSVFIEDVLAAQWTDTARVYPTADPSYNKAGIWTFESSAFNRSFVDNFAMRDL